MMLYHACWDMMFLFGIWMDWYAGMPGRLWQQTICWVFILLSGFCVQLGHRTLKRGAQVFAAGALVTVVTLVFMPEDRVVCPFFIPPSPLSQFIEHEINYNPPPLCLSTEQFRRLNKKTAAQRQSHAAVRMDNRGNLIRLRC